MNIRRVGTAPVYLSSRRSSLQGFTLLETAMVLLITGILLSSMLSPLGAHYQQQKRDSTEKILERIVNAVIGFAVANARLPCPAGENTHGLERSRCQGDHAFGYVPAVTLGVPGPTNAAGHLLDSWHRPIRYRVSDFDHPQHGVTGLPDYTNAYEMKSVGSRHWNSDIEICRQSSGSHCPRRALWANQVPLVLWSLGKDASPSGDQSENQDGDAVFVHRELSTNKADPFDDVVLWLSENRLIFDMLQAGQL